MRALYVLLIAVMNASGAGGGGATVEGRVIMKPTPGRRVASRYAGAPTAAAQQTLPTLVYLRGSGLPAARRSARQPEMAQHDTTFVPGALAVAAGTTVAFRNQDPFFHNIFSYSKPKRFDLGRFPRPESKPITFDKSGVVDVFCEIHKSMRGVILVTDNDYHTEAAGDGYFALKGVPPGKYELVVWNADHGQKVIPVTVPATGVVTVNPTY